MYLAFTKDSDVCDPDFLHQVPPSPRRPPLPRPPRPDGCAAADARRAQDALFYADFALDCSFLLDILVTFRTAFWGGLTGDELITSPGEIARRYVRGFLLLDVVSSLPYDAMLLSACGDLNGANRLLRGPKVIKVIRLVRVTKIMRITRLRNFLLKVRDILHLNPGAVRLVKFLIFVSLLTHYNACFFFFIGELFLDNDALGAIATAADGAPLPPPPPPPPLPPTPLPPPPTVPPPRHHPRRPFPPAGARARVTVSRRGAGGRGAAGAGDAVEIDKVVSWTTTYRVRPWGGAAGLPGEREEVAVHDLEWFQQYVASLYWAIATMTTTGFGDVVPRTSAEYLYCAFVIVQGGITFGCIPLHLSSPPSTGAPAVLTRARFTTKHVFELA